MVSVAKNNFFISSLILAFTLGCNHSVSQKSKSSSYSISQTDFATFLSRHNTRYEAHTLVVVIPNVGCGGCITQGEAYFMEHVDDSNYLFIFTMIQDMKLFRQSYIWLYSERENVIIDSKNVMSTIGFYADRPCFIETGTDNQLKVMPL